jgi:hypothetical protein
VCSRIYRKNQGGDVRKTPLPMSKVQKVEDDRMGFFKKSLKKTYAFAVWPEVGRRVSNNEQLSKLPQSGGKTDLPDMTWDALVMSALTVLLDTAQPYARKGRKNTCRSR